MKAYQMKITIKDSHPPIWRRFIVPAELSFSQLSVVLNEVMGWSGYHLFSFEFHSLGLLLEEGEEFGDEFEDDWILDDYDRDDASLIMLEAYLDEEKRFTYTYDFGDDWRHSVVVEKIIDDYEYNYPTVLKFKGDTPYEDCGGIDRYYEMLQTLENPSDPEYELLKEWTENHFTRKYDLEQVNSTLQSYKLENKKSKPMRQKEIYDELLVKGKGFKRIQGFKESVYRDYDGPDDYDDDDFVADDFAADMLTEIEAMLEDIEKRLIDSEKRLNGTMRQNWAARHDNDTLQDIYRDYTKDILVDIAKLHHIKGYSKYKKEELIEFLAQKVLDEEVMSRYLTFLTDEELALLDKPSASGSGEKLSAKETDHALYLVGAGYCGMSGDGDVVVPAEVRQRYREICSSEWKKARRQALELCCYLNGAADLYGICPVSQVIELYSKYTGKHLDEMAVYSFCELIPDVKKDFYTHGMQLIHKNYSEPYQLTELKRQQEGKPFYIPSRKEIEMLGSEGFLPFDSTMDDLRDVFSNQLDMDYEDAQYFAAHMQRTFRAGFSVDDALEWMDENDMLFQAGMEELFRKHLNAVFRHTRKRADRGNLPKIQKGAEEPLKNDDSILPFYHQKENIVEFPVDVKKKIYPNDPCPCGSGKKYKKCCGRNKK
ncbi:SEC-C metal-binding domain-containing protein [Blautia schinkii]|nr:SEC-C metal-binding domain-containing protein [Blautia schinkii]